MSDRTIGDLAEDMVFAMELGADGLMEFLQGLDKATEWPRMAKLTAAIWALDPIVKRMFPNRFQTEQIL